MKSSTSTIEMWLKMTLAEQMGNIGSEVSRAGRSYKKDEELFQGAVERGLELFDLTLTDPRRSEAEKREIRTAREVFMDTISGSKQYQTSFEDLIKYFDQFALKARKDY